MLFVIHKHHSRKLHFDLRLEHEGILKSWAVPKEPSMDPKIKRLAIQVSDHDISYADFEGEIDEGLYGAGKVEIWDSGEFEPIDIQQNKKWVFNLLGKKLAGSFALISFPKGGKNAWLFFKKKENV